MITAAVYSTLMPPACFGGFFDTVSQPTCFRITQAEQLQIQIADSPDQKICPFMRIFASESLTIVKGSRAHVGDIPLSCIRCLQDGLRRNAEEMSTFQRDIKENGLQTRLKLVMFREDGQIYVRDGNHRLAVLRSLGLKKLKVDQYELEVFSYKDFDEIVFALDKSGQLNVDSSWLTPFDPRTQTRRNNFIGFKSVIKMLYDSHLLTFEDLDKFIRDNQHLFLVM